MKWITRAIRDARHCPPLHTTMQANMIQKPSFKEALRFWTKLGFISFGGPAGQIAIMHEYLVDKKKWISESKFMHALNYCMILPGPEAQQLAAYTGWMLHGIRGGLAAGVLFILPSMFILLGMCWIYVTYGTIPWVYALFDGLKPAVIAIVILALIKIGKKSLLSPFHYFTALAAFICIFFFNIPFPLIIITTVVIALLVRKFFPQFFNSQNAGKKSSDMEEAGFYINKFTTVSDSGFSGVRLLRQIVVFLLLWMVPYALLMLLTTDFEFWQTVSLFFTQAAFVTFGGAYAVLPYVAQVSVERFGWLTELQMIDGLALGETTPGPLIMVLVFVGFMAGYNHFGGSLLMGSLGLVTTAFYTFLPCFLFIFVGAPMIEKTQENPKVKQMLSLVTAAVVGVVLNLTIYLGEAVLFPESRSMDGFDWVAAGWVAASFVAMYRFKVGMITWIGISALFGLVLHLISTTNLF